MSRVELPEGVAPTNEKTSFQTPDVATPDFARTPQESLKPKTVREKHETYERVVEEDEEDEDEDDEDHLIHVHGPHGPGQLVLMIAIALLLAALAVFVFMSNRQETPLCSEQPEWNQYNCRAG